MERMDSMKPMVYEYDAPWWWAVVTKWFPERCREVPRAEDPEVLLLRQFAIVKKYIYLQQFASAESYDWYHSHPWSWGTIAIGLWGVIGEETIGGVRRHHSFKAPYFRYMGQQWVHRSFPMSPGHTSIFIGLGRKTNEKGYYRRPEYRHWTEHVEKVVNRI